MIDDKHLLRKRKILYIVLFLFLNVLNCYLVTSSFYNRSINAYHRDIFMFFNYILGEIGFMVIILSIAVLLFKKDINKFRFLLIFSIFNAIICIGLMIFTYNYYGMMFSFGNLKALDNPAQGLAFKFVFSVLGDLLIHAQFISLIPPLILFVLFFRLKMNKNMALSTSMFGKGKSRMYFGVSLTVIGVLLMLNSLGSYKMEIDETWYEENRDVLYGVETVGLYNYYIYDFYSYHFTDIYELNEEKTKQIKDKLLEFENEYRLNPIDGLYYGNNSNLTGVYKNKNLILIQAESLSNFMIGLKVNGKLVTPNITRLASNGLYFDNFYTTVGIGNTSDAEFSVMTGFYPTGEDLAIYTFDKAEYETLAKDFITKGYNANSFHGNTEKFYSRGEVHPNLYGFQNHYGIESLKKESPLVHGWISDESLLKQSVDKMMSTGGLDFIYSVLVSCHTPYAEDDEIRRVLEENDFNVNEINNNLFRGYIEQTYYVDYAIGKLIEYLEENNLIDDTIIALYGDHGGGVSHEALVANKNILTNEINPFESPLFNYQTKMGQYAYRKISQEIPFIIYEGSSSKLVQPKTISLVRGETDIYRTFSNLFSLDSKYYFGVDGLSTEPSFLYNPRNLDAFTDAFTLFLPPLEIYTYPHKNYTNDKIKKMADIVKNYKEINDQILKYKNYK